MNKTELIEHIAKNADINKAQATRALEETMGAIKQTLRKGGAVNLLGFGSFYIGKRSARTGRNPRTGEAVEVTGKAVPYFKPGKELRERVNGGPLQSRGGKERPVAGD